MSLLPRDANGVLRLGEGNPDREGDFDRRFHLTSVKLGGDASAKDSCASALVSRGIHGRETDAQSCAENITLGTGFSERMSQSGAGVDTYDGV